MGVRFGAETQRRIDLRQGPPRRTARPTIASKIRPKLQNAAGISRPTAEDRVRGRISNFGGVSHGPPDRSFGKVPAEAGSRRLSSAAFFPPQPDFSHQKSGGLLIFAYSLLATLPRSTPPAEFEIRRESSVCRGLSPSGSSIFQAGIVLGPLIWNLLPRGPLRDSGPSPFSACPGKSAPTFLPGRGIRPGFGPAQFRIAD